MNVRFIDLTPQARHTYVAQHIDDCASALHREVYQDVIKLNWDIVIDTGDCVLIAELYHTPLHRHIASFRQMRGLK